MSFRSLDRTIRFRFVGRFVFAQKGNDKSPELKVLAIDPTFCRDVPSECHRVALTAPWDCVNPLGSCLPDLRLFSSSTVDPRNDRPGRLEQGVWFLDGCNIRIAPAPGGQPDFSWSDKDELLTFEALVNRKTASIDQRFTENVEGPTAAIFQVSTGSGRQNEAPEVSEKIVLAHLHTANQACADDEARKACDFVDVVLTKLKPDPYVISITSKDARRRCISFLTQPNTETVVSISNLCPKTSFETFDAEFASLYEVLAKPPETRMRRVPKAVPDLNGKIDCHSPVYGNF